MRGISVSRRLGRLSKMECAALGAYLAVDVMATMLDARDTTRVDAVAVLASIFPVDKGRENAPGSAAKALWPLAVAAADKRRKALVAAMVEEEGSDV